MPRFRIIQRSRNFAARDPFIKLWFVPVWIGLGVASLMIASLAFRRIAPRLGEACGITKPDLTASPAKELRAIQIRRAIQLAARYAPWRADCYPQAIVARFLLGLYGLPFTLSMGVRRDPVTGDMLAHAWVQCGRICVTGGDGDNEYSVVAVFAGTGRG